MDYSNKTAKIYKLNFPNNYYYIGSTIQTLKKKQESIIIKIRIL